MTDMTDMTEKGPGLARLPAYDYPAIARRLKRKPDEWEVIIEGCTMGIYKGLTSSGIAALRPELGFEFAKRGSTLHARFVPEKVATAKEVQAKRNQRAAYHRQYRAQRKAQGQ